MEPFWDLKISKNVENLTCVPSKYVTSCVLSSLTSTVGRTSHYFLAYVTLQINKASLALYITHTKPRACSRAIPRLI